MLTRYAIVGTGARAEMFTRALTGAHRDTCALVALADPEPARLAVHNARLPAPVPTYPAADFTRMLHEQKVDVAIVTTVDRYHDEYIVAALDAGCDVLTEKPMTIDATRCARILDAVRRTGRRVRVTFNYRYNPVHETFKQAIAGGLIGKVGSVHFEWLLDVRHGADYFRRWHREKANSGGLLVHKAGHHFDLVNWWLNESPQEVYAQGRRFFYGPGGAGAAHDRRRFALGADPHRDELYRGTGDGYRRDQDVFAPGVTIEDDLSVLVRYTGGATMTYHLTAYAPWEGYRVMCNGSLGRLELEVVESDHVAPGATGLIKGTEPGRVTLLHRPLWAPARELPVPGYTREGHGGGDARMLADLLGAGTPSGIAAAEAADGAQALAIGLAANESIATGAPVRTGDLF